MKLFILLASLSLSLNIKDKEPNRPATIGRCSAVLLEDGYVLTAAHCASRHTVNVWAKDITGKSYEMEMVSRDPVRDLMLIKFTGPRPMHLPYAKLGVMPKRTDKVFNVNAGRGMSLTYTEGLVNNLIRHEFQSLIMHSASILPAASGSGLFDKKGRLIGINTLRFDATVYAVNIDEIRDFLAEAREDM